MVLNEKTNIPLFAVLGTLPFIIGFAVWLTNIDAKASDAKAQAELTDKVVRRMDKNVIIIMTKMGITPENE